AAQLLDADGEGYVAAVDAAHAALRDPELTPSARLLADLGSERMSFFEYAHALARRHHEYFMALEPDVGREQMLDALAARSLERAVALEAAEQPPFGEYLRREFG